MISPVVEEALANIVRRLNELEEFQRKYYAPRNDVTQKTGLATENQISYIKGLGGNPKDDMTKAEAGQMIDELLESKKERILDNVEIPEVKEPKEVDTDDAGIGEGDLL